MEERKNEEEIYNSFYYYFAKNGFDMALHSHPRGLNLQQQEEELDAVIEREKRVDRMIKAGTFRGGRGSY